MLSVFKAQGNVCVFVLQTKFVELCKMNCSKLNSGLKNVHPEDSLEGLKLKLQNFGHLMQRTDSLEKTLMMRKILGGRRGRQRRRRLDVTTD